MILLGIVMETTMKMSQRPNPSALPSIYGESTTKASFSENQQSQRSNVGHPQPRLSAHSSTGQYSSVIISSARVPSTVEAFFPAAEEIDTIDLGRIRIEKRSHKQLLPPSVCHHLHCITACDLCNIFFVNI